MTERLTINQTSHSGLRPEAEAFIPNVPTHNKFQPLSDIEETAQDTSGTPTDDSMTPTSHDNNTSPGHDASAPPRDSPTPMPRPRNSMYTYTQIS